MWPWSDDEYARGYNLAFVAFVFRSDAEKAMSSLQGATFKTMQLKMSWSKVIFSHAILYRFQLSEKGKSNPLILADT